MKLIHRSTPAGTTAELIVGMGLVGDGVAHAIHLLPGVVSQDTVPTAWGNQTELRASLDRVRPSCDRIRLFWCAGRAGFGSTREICDAELQSFETVLAWAVELSRSTPLEFHLSSSAGGLHEGQLLVNDASAAFARRPYGELKLQQERALHASSLTSRFVYRLSSVYGVPLLGRRSGLVSTMVVNALQHRSTQITAHSWTQRDFVFAADVGAFIAREGNSVTRSLHEGVHYLVSGLPLSIWSLQLALERHLFTRVSVHYTTGKENFASTTFSPALRPARWAVSSVESNLPRLIATAHSSPLSPLRREKETEVTRPSAPS